MPHGAGALAAARRLRSSPCMHPLHASLRGAGRVARPAVLAVLTVLVLVAAACARTDDRPLDREQRAAIADSIAKLVARAYDLRAADPAAGMLSLYPAEGSVVSAVGGRVTTSRDSLAANIRAFWNNVGRNMRQPVWIWETMRIDVLAPDAAVMTATYRVPHLTPRGAPHEIGGAWTAVFERRGGRWVIVHEHLSDAPSPRDSMVGTGPLSHDSAQPAGQPARTAPHRM